MKLLLVALLLALVPKAGADDDLDYLAEALDLRPSQVENIRHIIERAREEDKAPRDVRREIARELNPKQRQQYRRHHGPGHHPWQRRHKAPDREPPPDKPRSWERQRDRDDDRGWQRNPPGEDRERGGEGRAPGR